MFLAEVEVATKGVGNYLDGVCNLCCRLSRHVSSCVCFVSHTEMCNF